MDTADSTQRCSNRVDDYVRWRPGYPPALLDWMQRQLGITPRWHVADIWVGAVT